MTRNLLLTGAIATPFAAAMLLILGALDASFGTAFIALCVYFAVFGTFAALLEDRRLHGERDHQESPRGSGIVAGA